MPPRLPRGLSRSIFDTPTTCEILGRCYDYSSCSCCTENAPAHLGARSAKTVPSRVPLFCRWPSPLSTASRPALHSFSSVISVTFAALFFSERRGCGSQPPKPLLAGLRPDARAKCPARRAPLKRMADGADWPRQVHIFRGVCGRASQRGTRICPDRPASHCTR